MESKVEWETDFRKALERSKSDGKLVLLDFFNPG